MNTVKNIILLVLVILVQAILEYISADKGVYKHILTDYSSIIRLIQGYLLFILVYKIKVNNNKCISILTEISKLTLDIYLASFITDRLTYKVLKPYDIPQENYIYLMIPLVFTSFIFAYLIAKLRTKYIKLR